MDFENNIVPGRSKLVTAIRRIANDMRSFWMLKFKYPWIKSKGFLRIPKKTAIWSPHKHVTIGDHVQFGPHCRIQCDIEIGNYVLMAANVSFYRKR